MIETSETCRPQTSEDSGAVTFSPGSGVGRLPFDWPAGQTTSPPGPALVRASGSPVPAVGARPRTISGSHSSASSEAPALVVCLANRLTRPGNGWTGSSLILNRWATPSMRAFYRLTLSASTMRASGFTLQATPTAKANQAAPYMRRTWPGCREVVVSPEAWCRRMGYPPEWLNCAPSGMPSCQISLPLSSDP